MAVEAGIVPQVHTHYVAGSDDELGGVGRGDYYGDARFLIGGVEFGLSRGTGGWGGYRPLTAPGDGTYGFLLRRIHGHPELACVGRIHKLDKDVVADAFQVAIVPFLERNGGDCAAAFPSGALIAAARRMVFDFRRPGRR